MDSNAKTVQKLHLHLPQNTQEYIDIAEKLSALVDQELSRVESNRHEGRFHDVILRLPAIISAVNTIGYLRGEDGMFLDFRPKDIQEKGVQGALYANEEAFEHRLQALIDYLSTTKEADFYRETLERYYITARTARITQ
jgi:hypothetical protein